MKFVTSSDWHLANKGPVSRKDDWMEAMFGKLEQLSSLAIAQRAHGIICGGDVFNKENRVDWHLLNRLIEWCFRLREHGIQVYGIPGNHDLKNDRYDSVGNQPIGLIFASKAMIDVSYNPVVLTDSEGLKVSITGIPYPAAKFIDNYDRLPRVYADKHILVTHCFGTPDGGEYYGEPMVAYKHLFGLDYDVFVFGHDHSDNGVKVYRTTEPLKTAYFINNGAMSRGSISKDNVDRVVKCTLVDILRAAITVTELRMKVSPASEVFDLVLKHTREREEDRVSLFVESLVDDLKVSSEVDLMSKIGTLPIPEDVKARALAYLASAEVKLQVVTRAPNGN